MYNKISVEFHIPQINLYFSSQHIIWYDSSGHVIMLIIKLIRFATVPMLDTFAPVHGVRRARGTEPGNVMSQGRQMAASAGEMPNVFRHLLQRELEQRELAGR